MNLRELQRKLLAAARTSSPSDRVPFAFEKRVMARVRAGVSPDPWALWARALWRAAAGCGVVVMLTGVWAFWEDANSDPKPDLAQEFENAVFAAMDQESDYVP